MEELQKWELINKAETIKELQDAILLIGDENGNVPGRKRNWPVKDQAEDTPFVAKGLLPANTLTRSYGIRAQALYLKYYNSN